MPDIKNMEVVQENSCDIYSDGTVFNGYDTDSADALYVKKLRAEGQNLDSGMFALQPISNSAIGNFFRGGAESVTNIVAQAGNNAAIAYRTIMDAYGEHFKTLTDEELKFNKQIVENLRIQNQEIADSIHEFFGAEDESLAAKIGSGVVQSAASIGFNAIGASPLMIAMFGVNTAGEVMAKSRETGRSAVESLARGTGAGLAEAKLESWGLQNLVENITANTVRKAAAKSFATEFIEEASQSLSTAFFSYGLDNRDLKTYITDSLKDAFEEGVYGGISGGITGGAGAGIRRLANGGFKNSMIDSMQKKLGRTLNKEEVEAIDKVVNRGEVSMEKAVEDSVKTLNNADEMRQAIQDTINEQIDRTKYGNDFNYSNISGRAKEIMDEILAGKRQMEENNHAAVVELVSSNSNLNQENKDRTIAMMEAFLAANEETFGVSVADQLKDFTNMKIRSESEAVSESQEETYLNEAGELVDKTTGQILFQKADEIYGYQKRIQDRIDYSKRQIQEWENYRKESNKEVFFQKENEQIRGQVDIAKKLVDVFKTGNRDTVVHEMNHLFSIYKINLAINNNKLDTLAPLFKHFGLEQTIENAEKLKNETYYQEELAKMSINYIAQHEAPNVALRKYFQEFKQWAQSVWENLVNKGLVQKEELSQDIVDFFDSMYSTKEVDVEKAKNELKELIKQIKSGKAVNIDNINIDDVYRLLDAKYRRIPRAPKNLKQKLIAAGGIDNKLAESLDLKPLMGEQDNKYTRLFRKEGKIKDETQLVEFLKSEGFMTQMDAETYGETSNEFDRAMNLLENAENTYSENDAAALMERENVMEAVSQAEEILDRLNIDGEDVKQYISELKKNDIVAVSKSEVKELNNKIKNLEKEYKKLSKEKVKEAVDSIKEYRNKIIDFIKSQSIDSADKAKLITEIKKANTELSLKKTMDRVKERAEAYYTQEQVRILENAIDKEVKKSKPVDIKKQRYDYENNKLFKALREDSKLTQEQAKEKWNSFSVEENGEVSHAREIEKAYLAYKMNGAKSSPQLLEFVLNEIKNAKDIGRKAKDDMELERKLELKDNKNEILSRVADRKVANKFENKLAVMLNNLHSMLNLVAGKEVADKFEMETVENNMVIHKTKILEGNLHTAQDIYGFKSKGDFLNKIADMRKVIGQLRTKTETGLNLSYDITKMGIIDLYNDSQNTKVRDDLEYYYGKEQIESLFELLTTQDIEFANSMREAADSLYPEINQVYIEQYGIDLNKTENYWMLSTEHQKDSDLLADFSKISNTPSFFEERTKSRVLVVPKDAYNKFKQHVAGACYMTDMAREFKNLRDTFNSVRVKNAIQNKFGNEVWNNINKQINRLSYGEYMQGTQQDEVSSILSRMVNNFITAKIAIAPSVFVKQLTSASNYAENMGYGAWGKGFIEGISNPKKTIEYMYKYAGDFLRTRSQIGYDEAMSRITQQVQQVKKTIFTPKMQNNYTEVMSYMTKQGDITAIIFGGYPRLKSMIESGMPVEDAVKQFRFETLRGQQSGMTSSLSNFQNNRNAFVRLMFAFKNTPQQYLRKINDTIVSAINGDIKLEDASRKLFNYAVVQPTLYVLAGNLVYNAFSPDDDDREWTDGIMSQLAFQFIDPIPFVDKLARQGYRRLTGQYAGQGMPVVGYDDLMRSFNKMAKSGKTNFDYAEIFVPFIEGLSGLPAGRAVKNLKTLAE